MSPLPAVVHHQQLVLAQQIVADRGLWRIAHVVLVLLLLLLVVEVVVMVAVRWEIGVVVLAAEVVVLLVVVARRVDPVVSPYSPASWLARNSPSRVDDLWWTR